MIILAGDEPFEVIVMSFFLSTSVRTTVTKYQAHAFGALKKRMHWYSLSSL